MSTSRAYIQHSPPRIPTTHPNTVIDVLSAALDAGTAVATVLVYFCLQYPHNGNIGSSTIRNWWGNTVFRKTADWNAVPLRQLAEGETFGPDVW
ncbi:hypothetical protein NLI96_g5748 [Meripilus lineatus]|uniref:Uncharacterized protein n=1 Tax=Meripilus lineatus TaxID=2056292 RepID=A0AAD5V7T2_9APHY|nr:hypothetical protein NLI96_g5748 [Physisporinus lineatus]